MPVIAGKRLFHVTTLATLMAFLFSAGLASAHGKEVNIAVSCGAPDPGRPLTRVSARRSVASYPVRVQDRAVFVELP